MKIQKPTVLDAARLAPELERFQGAIIEQALMDSSASHLYLILKYPDAALSFIVEKRYAYLGLTSLAHKDNKIIRALTGYTITGAAQLGYDRIVELKLERQDRLGRRQTANLILELIPNKGDAILIDDNRTIKWTLKNKVGKYISPPELKKATVLNFDLNQILSTLEKPEQISDSIYGLNDRDLINLRFEGRANMESALGALKTYVAKASRPGPGWVIYRDNQAAGYSLLSPVLLSGESAREYSSALEMYEAYYSQASGQESEQDRVEFLQRITGKEISRERGKLSSIQIELENARAAGEFRRYGELILANIDLIKRGAKTVHLQDFDRINYIDIQLDPSKPAAANAEDYFKRARKAASSLNILTARFGSTKKRLAQLEAVKTDNIENLESGLISLNLLSLKPGSKVKKTVAPRLPYKRFRASSGWEIWVGRTNKDNDELTFKIAHKDDYWFHAWQAAGSHTVLRLPDRRTIPDKQTLLEAASLAAYFSKARTSSKVPVAYTKAKFVHKPKNFPPGKVMIEKEKQLMVRPADPEKYFIKNE